QVALKADGISYLEFLMGGLRESIEIPFEVVLNGYLVCFIILNLLLIHVPLLVALVAGDSVAGEANMGTLRLLLTRPVSRTRLMLVKFAASMIYTIMLLAWMALLSLVLSILLFGTNDMIITRNDVVEQIQRNDILWRYFAAFGYAGVALTTVAALAFLLSVFADNSIGPIVSTISIVIIFTILSEMEIPIYDTTVKPWLFTSHMLAWKGFFYSKSNGQGEAIKGSLENFPAIMRSMSVLLAYIVLFVGSAVMVFRKKDILS
ncbi:MAG TPA: ABC transporter permease subunit, partial [Chitinophagaceae bacterium]|nr:ABC transporter permease subunit [Chitinophagaceae bacterium]